MKKVLFILSSLLLILPAEGYLGPGIGVGTLGFVFGTIASIFLTFVVVIYYPIKRMFKSKWRKTNDPSVEGES
ncbi:MAG: hypothetical protein IPJ71_14430 [Bdellovibrionales bacterium]|nr:hypothetical protein [Bdellovibrionales bacterium]